LNKQTTKQLLSSRHGAMLLAAAALLASIGISLIVYGVMAINRKPVYIPPTNAASSAVAATRNQSSPTVQPAQFSQPKSISVSSLGIKSEIISLKKDAQGRLEVPRDKNVNKVGWYSNSPTPGQIGASILVGHLDQYDGSPSVFFRLGEIEVGSLVEIIRQDGDTIRFKVTDKSKVYKNEFPTDKVYQSTKSATIHLITCGGWYDANAGDYDSNVIVTAELVQ
jgi:sortase (surface protein transpeptidase)